MLGHDPPRGVTMLSTLAHRMQRIPRGAGGGLMRHDRRRIAQTGRPGPEPGRVDKSIRHRRQFRHIGAHETPVRVLVVALLDRIIDAHCIDPGGAGLHLHLRPVNAGLVINEFARQMQPGRPPGQPEMIAGKGHQHRAHPEIDPAMVIERAHTGVDKGIAGAPRAPRGQALRIGGGGAQAIIGAVEVLEFDPRLILELLHEVAMPMLPPGKGDHRGAPICHMGGIIRLELVHPRPTGLCHFA